MSQFEYLYGISETDVRKDCILVPFLTQGLLKSFGISKLQKGKLYASASTSQCTLICTGVGASMCGDCVLGLDSTEAENIYFIGACGALASAQFQLGDVVIPKYAISVESFSKILQKDFKFSNKSHPDTNLFKRFKNIKPVNCLSFGSIVLEENFINEFKKENIEVIEMECAALFHAARHIKRKAVALLFISDILREKPFYEKPSHEDSILIKDGALKAAEMIFSKGTDT